MPHVTLEYSANVAEVVDIDALVNVTHEAVLATGVAPLSGLRTRAVARAHYRIADGDEANMFLAVMARFAPRPQEDVQLVITALIEAISAFVGDARSHMAISVEFQEIDPGLRLNLNGLTAHVGGSQ